MSAIQGLNMCGRFAQTNPNAIASHFKVEVDPVPAPRFNIAPSQMLGVIGQGKSDGRRPVEDHRAFRSLQWGFVPSWAKGKAKPLINARAETAPEKASFRSAFQKRRCLIPATGFYEWKSGEQGKTPFCFHLGEHQLFAFAGLWEFWQDIPRCTILTTEANSVMRPVHHRMPVIVAVRAYDAWLNPDSDVDLLRSLLKPYPAERMQAYPVSPLVNNPGNDTPECLEEI